MNNKSNTKNYRRVTSVGVLCIALLGCIFGIVLVYHGMKNAGNGFAPFWGIHGVTSALAGIVGMGLAGTCVHIAAYAMLVLMPNTETRRGT